jgi:segregation and condensation protein B
MTPEKIKNIIEAILLSAEHPMSVLQVEALFQGDLDCPSRDEIRKAFHELGEDYASRGFELKEVASGYRLQVKQEFAEWVGRLWEEKPARYSRALLETIALIAYRQPITRGEIEEVRGVSVSTNIIKTLIERDWVKVLGHKDVPGKPSLYGTTREFLDYFNLKSLDELPTLAEIKDLDKIHPELALDEDISEDSAEQPEGQVGDEEAAVTTAEAATAVDDDAEDVSIEDEDAEEIDIDVDDEIKDAVEAEIDDDIDNESDDEIDDEIIESSAAG